MGKGRSSYSHAEFAAAYAKAGLTHSPWRHVIAKSANERTFVRQQVLIAQAAYLLGVHLILIAEHLAPSLSRQLLWTWYAAALANVVLRKALFAYFFTRSPEAVTTRGWVQFIPMLNVIIAGAHWSWTATLFVDPAWSFTALVTLLVFLLMSVATTTFAPQSPLAMVTYWVLMWVPAVVGAWPGSPQGHGAMRELLVLTSVVALAVCAYVSQRQVRRYVQAADSIEALIAQLREKNEELQRLRSEASEQLQERSQFFSSASHDFGQRLHAMKLLAHSAMTSDRPGRARSLTVLSGAVEDLEHYVRDVLEFARIESRVVTPNYSRFHLQDVFQRLALQFESVADARGVALRFRTTTAEVETDQGVLVRALENLIGNAIKFTRRGVLVAARRRGQSWRIEIWDQGLGIPQRSLNAIFASFYQERVYADRQEVGVGLGLAIVKRFADGLHYTLRVQSCEGRGSVFKVLVPAQARRIS